MRSVFSFFRSLHFYKRRKCVCVPGRRGHMPYQHTQHKVCALCVQNNGNREASSHNMGKPFHKQKHPDDTYFILN